MSEMKLYAAMSVVTVGAMAACAQILWAHGVTNRIGELAFLLSFGFALLPVIMQGMANRRRNLRRLKKQSHLRSAQRAELNSLRKAGRQEEDILDALK